MEVNSADPGYTPVIHKTIVWSSDSGGWPIPPDPTRYHEPVPDLPLPGMTWLDRESIDVPSAMQTDNLLANPKWLAVQSHYSQAGDESFIAKFVHKDEIFWLENLTGSNQPPLVNAGADQTINAGTDVQLDGSLSGDPDGDDLNFEWQQVDGLPVVLSSQNTANPIFSTPIGLTHDEKLSFQLVIYDGNLESATDLVIVTIRAAQHHSNAAPLAASAASSVDGD